METCEVLWEQFQEDRALLKEQYGELRKLVSGSVERYSVVGDTLGKYAELMTKQTSQVLDFLKMIKQDEKESETLSQEDLLKISESLTKK